MTKYSITYQITTPESAEAGDYSEQGYEVQDETLDTFREVVDLIKSRGFSEPSCSPVRNTDTHIWFSTPDPERDYHTGEETYYCLHIDDPNTLRHLISYLKAVKYIR